MNRAVVRAVAGSAAGGGAILLAQAVTWASVRLPRPGGPVAHLSVTGHAVAPALPAVGWALLALSLALFAATGRLRQAVGALVALAGAGGVGVAMAAREWVGAALTRTAYPPPPAPLHPSPGAWWLLAATGGALAVLTGLVVLARGGRWGGLGARYEQPAASGEPAPARAGVVTDEAVWRALDRGEDPTA